MRICLSSYSNGKAECTVSVGKDMKNKYYSIKNLFSFPQMYNFVKHCLWQQERTRLEDKEPKSHLFSFVRCWLYFVLFTYLFVFIYAFIWYGCCFYLHVFWRLFYLNCMFLSWFVFNYCGFYCCLCAALWSIVVGFKVLYEENWNGMEKREIIKVFF